MLYPVDDRTCPVFVLGRGLGERGQALKITENGHVASNKCLVTLQFLSITVLI